MGSPLYNVHHRIGTLAFCASHRKHSELSSSSWAEVELFFFLHVHVNCWQQWCLLVICLVLAPLMFDFTYYVTQYILFHLAYRRLEMQLRGRDVEQWMSHRRLPEHLKRYEMF